MDRRALKYFFVVAKLSSIRAASNELHVAPSAISRQIKSLEEQLHVSLLNRLGRGVEVTAAGDQLVRYIKALQLHEDDFLARLSDMQELRIGCLRIATGGGLMNDLLTGAISHFWKRHPGIRFVLNICGGDDIIRQVRDDEVDLGLVLNSPADPQIEKLLSCRFPPLNLIVQSEASLSTLSSCSLAQLQSIPLALLNKSFSLRQSVQQLEDEYGVQFQPLLECNSFETLKVFTLNGQGGTLLPTVCIAREIENNTLKAIPLEAAQPNRSSVDLIIRRGRKHTAGIQAIRQYMKDYMVVFNDA